MSEHRCPVYIWNHSPASRCILRLAHGGLHEDAAGHTRHGTVGEQANILALTASHLFDNIADDLGITSAVAWLERKLSRRS